MNKQEIIKQTQIAYQFLQKLYFESSYLIKEVEGLLGKESEEFIIGRPSGYSVATNRSAGLEATNVESWSMRKMAVFFIPKKLTIEKGGQTITKFEAKPKVIYLRIVLDAKGMAEPKIFAGILHDFLGKGKLSMEKVEQLMTHIEYRDMQVFKNPYTIDYADGYLSFRGNLFGVNLLDVNSSEDVYNKIVVPAVELFRKN